MPCYRNRDQVSLTRLQFPARRIERQRRIGTVGDEMSGAIRDLRILFHQHLEVILVAMRGRVPHYLVEEIDCSCRAYTAYDTELERPLARRHRLRHNIVRVDAVRIEHRHRTGPGHKGSELGERRKDELRPLARQICAGGLQRVAAFPSRIEQLVIRKMTLEYTCRAQVLRCDDP